MYLRKHDTLRIFSVAVTLALTHQINILSSNNKYIIKFDPKKKQQPIETGLFAQLIQPKSQPKTSTDQQK